MTDTERTDDAAFDREAGERIGNATREQTEQTANEEDGGSPDEPQPDTFPDDDEQTDDDPPAAS